MPKPRETELWKVKKSSGRSTKPLSWEPANSVQGLWPRAGAAPHHSPTGIGVVLWTLLFSSPCALGQQHWHWDGDTCPSSILGQLRSGWRILFSSQSGGNFLLSQHIQGLPCHAQGPVKDQEMEQRLLLALSLLFHHPTITQTPQEALADRKAPGAGGSTALRGIFPHPRGCTSS